MGDMIIRYLEGDFSDEITLSVKLHENEYRLIVDCDPKFKGSQKIYDENQLMGAVRPVVAMIAEEYNGYLKAIERDLYNLYQNWESKGPVLSKDEFLSCVSLSSVFIQFKEGGDPSVLIYFDDGGTFNGHVIGITRYNEGEIELDPSRHRFEADIEG